MRILVHLPYMESETTKKVICRGNVRVMGWITDNNGGLDYERNE
jgi:hypothetical protein